MRKTALMAFMAAGMLLWAVQGAYAGDRGDWGRHDHHSHWVWKGHHDGHHHHWHGYWRGGWCWPGGLVLWGGSGYHQGFRDGYRLGLHDGYSWGYRDATGCRYGYYIPPRCSGGFSIAFGW